MVATIVRLCAVLDLEGGSDMAVAKKMPALLRYTPAVPSPWLSALLVRANGALERGRGAEAAQLVAPALRAASLNREDELAIRATLADAWLLQDDLDQAAAVLGRPPDAFRDTVSAL